MKRRKKSPLARPPVLAAVVWKHVREVIDDQGGNVTHAALVLEVDRRTLQRLLRRGPPRRRLLHARSRPA